MMNDIVERLRGAPKNVARPIVMTENGYTRISKMNGAMLNEAANNILQKNYVVDCKNVARAALKENK